MRDLATKIAAVAALGPVAANADATSAAIDLQGYDGATIVLGIGVGGIAFDATNKIEFVVTHSDDNVSYSQVAASDLCGPSSPAAVSGGIVKSLVAAHPAIESFAVGYVGNRRYLKVLADFSGTHGTATPLSVTVIKGAPRRAP
ncbi:hypothetical protein [Kaistia terrae]|uniref:Uncharacterized protein n=1 Tax=Kaistia terrae TaxID=537017 RepID=A0ABW0Q2U6_9HYPH|nr:hypothetical protein [Kaistia terrae]MCX5581330.1 hypothetical protein [Kaistia terrae]